MRLIIISLLVLTIAPFSVLAQDNSSIICSNCQQLNYPDNNYCTSCGTELTEQRIEAQEKKPFTFREPSRLFSIPTAGVIPELLLGFTLGNSFGQQERQSFLGNVSVGIGDIAELELNTGGMVGNIVAGTTRMSTWAMKVQVYSGDEQLPAAALSLRSSNDWDDATFDSQAIETGSPGYYREGLRGLDYDTRITTAYVSLSRRIHERTTIHGTVGFSDIRHRNLGVQRINSAFRYDPSVRRSSQWQLSGGFAIDMNPRTKILAEIQTIPFFNYNVTNGELTLEHMYVSAAGVRFALSKAFTLDSGIRYQSNFVGLADTQVRVALNGILALPF